MKKNIVKGAFVLALGMCAVFTACSKKEVKNSASKVDKDQLVIAMDPRKINGPFDPCKGWGFTGVTLFQSKLLEVDAQDNLVNDLAESYSFTADGLKCTFKIKSNVKFSDGSPLTAKDVAFTYNTTKQTGQNVDLTRVKSITAIDDTTVEFVFTQPDSVFIYQTAILGIVPEALYDDSYGMNPVGSGPFKMISWTQGQQLVLEPNEYFYGTKSPFKKIVILMMKNDAAFTAVKSGAVDFASVNENQIAEDIPGFRKEILDTYGYRIISLPVVPEHEENGIVIGNNVTSDFNIRKAISIGINRADIVSGALNGIGKVEFDMNAHLPWSIDDVLKDATDNRVQEANNLLEENGWILGSDGFRSKNGLKAEFSLMYPPSDSGRQAIAQIFKEQLKPLGIKVNLLGIELDDQKKDGLNKREPCVLGGGAYSPSKIYHMLYAPDALKIGTNNIACVNDEFIQENIRKAVESTDFNESLKYWKLCLSDPEHGASFVSQNPYICVAFITHDYFARDGLSIGKQKIHPHDHNVSVLFNLNEWKFD